MPKVAPTKRSERKAAASEDGESEVERAAGAGVPKRITWNNCCFTINNPRKLADGTFEPLFKCLPERCSYVVWSLEKGKNGTPHYQGYLELIKQVESANAGPIKKILGYPDAHCEKRRGTAKQAADYCKKLDDTHVDGPWEFGEMKHQGQSETGRLEKEEQNAYIGDLREGFKNLRDIPNDLIRSCPMAIKMALTMAPLVRRESVDIYYIEGPTGIGKTYGIFERFPDAYRPIVSGVKVWFDGYDGQETVGFPLFLSIR